VRKIVISGWYGCGNLGDEAILLAMLDTFRERYPGARFIIVSEVPEQVERDYAGLYPLRGVAQRSYYSPLEFASGLLSGALPRVWSAIAGADLFLLGGGGLLRDNTSRRNLVRILDECTIARLLGVPVAFFALGVGPIRTAWAARLIRRAANRAAIITVRDRASAELLHSIGVASTPIRVTADPAFLLRGEDGADGLRRLIPERLLAEGRLVGVFPCEGLFWGDRGEPVERARILGEIASLCDRLVRRTALTPVFMPLRTGVVGDDDLVVVDEILARMETRPQAIRVPRVPPPKALRSMMARFRYVVGARLHSLILAAAAGTPLIGLDYEPKVRHFLGTVGPHGFLADLGDLSAARCTAFVEDYEAGYESRRAGFSALAAERARAALTTFDIVAEAARE